MMKVRTPLDAIEAVSVRVSKVRSLCVGTREALDSMPPLGEDQGAEWAIVAQDLIAVMEDEISLLLDEVREASTMALQKTPANPN